MMREESFKKGGMKNEIATLRQHLLVYKGSYAIVRYKHQHHIRLSIWVVNE